MSWRHVVVMAFPLRANARGIGGVSYYFQVRLDNVDEKLNRVIEGLDRLGAYHPSHDPDMDD